MVYMRMGRLAENGVLDRAYEKLQAERVVRIKTEAHTLIPTSVKVCPGGTGRSK